MCSYEAPLGCLHVLYAFQNFVVAYCIIFQTRSMGVFGLFEMPRGQFISAYNHLETLMELLRIVSSSEQL